MTNTNTTINATTSNNAMSKLKKRYTIQKIALIVAIICSVINYLAYFQSNVHVPDTLCTISIVAGFACYIIGGLRNVISFAVHATKIAWFAVPIFPIDLIVGVMGFAIILITAMLLPFAAMLACCLQTRSTLVEAGAI